MLELGRIITRGRRFIAEVDGLRFVAIMAVVLFHVRQYTLEKHFAGVTIRPYEAWLPDVLYLGRYGVQLFFILSGFLLVMPFAKWRLGLGPKPSLRTYYLRRLTRLEPPYLLSMLLLFAGGIVAYGVAAGLANWPNLLASLIYQHNLIFGEKSAVSVVAWSLEIEVQFYILAPFFAVIFFIRDALARRAVLVSAMIAIPLLRSLLPFYMAGRFNSLPWYLEFFVAGFILADFYLVDWKEAPKHTLGWDLASLAGWPALVALLLWGQAPALIAPVALVAYFGAFRGTISSRFFCHPVITLTGGMCYSMYLLHYAVISASGRLFKRFLIGSNFTTRFVLDALVVIPVVLVVTGVFFVLIERPCMDPTWPSKVSVRIRRLFAGVSQAESADS